MRIYKILLIWIMACGMSGFRAYSQDSLAYYLEQAALNNPGVKARFLEYSSALQKAPQAASLPDPELQFGYFIEPMELLDGNQVASIQLMQMFPWFGTLKAAKDEASKMAVMKFESFREARNELYFNVKSSYYQVYRTKKEIEIAEKNLGILRTLEQVALVKFRSGGKSSYSGSGSSMSSGGNKSFAGTSAMSSGNSSMSGQSGMGSGAASSSGATAMPSTGGGMSGSGKSDMVNLLRVQIEIHELENRIILLKDQLQTDKVSFSRYLNRTTSNEIFTGDSLVEASVPANILSMADSISNHPMVKMYEAESKANAAKITMVKRMGFPMVGLGVNYNVIQMREGNESMMNGKDMIMPMASITLPIYRKKYKAMRREAEFMRDAATASAENAKNDLQVSFRQTLQNIYDAERRIKLYTGQASLASKSVQLLIAAFSANGADFEEVLRMEQQLLDYSFKQVEAVVDKNRSVAQLVYLSGN